MFSLTLELYCKNNINAVNLIKNDNLLLQNFIQLKSRIDIITETICKDCLINNLIVASGFRDVEYNQKIKGANGSLHCNCRAIDFQDIDGTLEKWAINNKNFLFDLKVRVEHPYYTKGWIHFDIGSATKIVDKVHFIPSPNPPLFWHTDLQFKDLKI